MNEELVPLMPGAKCDRCRERINQGIFMGQLNTGKMVYFCKKCHSESIIHPIGGKKVK